MIGWKILNYSIPIFQEIMEHYLFSMLNYNRILMEEFNLQIKGEFQQIFKVLSKQQHDKMPFEGIQIAKSLSRLPFFRRFFDTNSENFINLCIAQDAIVVPQGTSIYARQANQGRERYIYVVLQGSFSAFSQQCPKKHLGILRIFGQTQILYGLEGRKETVIALELSKVMRIKETAILKIFNKRDDIKKCLHFLDVNQYFQELKSLEKMQLALSMVRHPFQKGSILKSEGQKVEQVFFLIYGKVEVTTHINKNSKDKEYIIDYLEELSNFGEYESFTGIGTVLRLRGIISGAYYSLNYAEIKRENHKIAQIIEQNAVPYPNNEQLQFLQGVKSTLRNEQKRVVKGLNYYR